MNVRGWKWEETVWGVMQPDFCSMWDAWSAQNFWHCEQGWVLMPKRWGENKFPLPDRMKTNSCSFQRVSKSASIVDKKSDQYHGNCSETKQVCLFLLSYVCFFHPIRLKGYLSFLSLPPVIAYFDNSAYKWEKMSFKLLKKDKNTDRD